MSPYTIRSNPRTRRITIRVRRGGTVVVTKPRWVSKRAVEAYVEKSRAWIARAQARLGTATKTSRVESSAKEYKKYKKAAHELIVRRMQHFARTHDLRWEQVSVRNQKSRWGSCSQRGTLSFNYRLVFLPRELADYVVVHELAHLKHLNHSRAFWALVGDMLPGYKEAKKELRRYERGLLLD